MSCLNPKIRANMSNSHKPYFWCFSLFLRGRNSRMQKFQRNKYLQNSFSWFWHNTTKLNSAKIIEIGSISKTSSIKLKSLFSIFLCMLLLRSSSCKTTFVVIFSYFCWKDMHLICEIFCDYPPPPVIIQIWPSWK